MIILLCWNDYQNNTPTQNDNQNMFNLCYVDIILDCFKAFL